jgi:hypothetical protein
MAINLSQTGAAVKEVLGKYMDWDGHSHGANEA